MASASSQSLMPVRKSAHDGKALSRAMLHAVAR
jgi:hypothetical protein